VLRFVIRRSRSLRGRFEYARGRAVAIVDRLSRDEIGPALCRNG
jgi:hypothetical protein